jgi:type II secretory pathway pseudopilin PulG
MQSARRQRDGGYLLLAILLMMALMVIAATVVAPRVVQQIKRDREEEMIHRGTEYARAIKKFYKKNGRYPSSLDDLDKNTQIRYLRKRYKDPLTKDGKWKLLNYGDIQTLLNTSAPGTPAAALGQGGAATTGGTSGFGNNSGFGGNSGFGNNSSSTASSNFGGNQQQQQQQQVQQQLPGANTGGFPTNSDQGSNTEGVPGNPGVSAGQSGSDQGFVTSNTPAGGNQQNGQPGGSNSQSSSPFGQNTTGNNQQFGGGAVVGVASLSKDPTIRIYNKKKTYDQWQFIYNPIMDQANVLLRGPYQPTTIGGNNQIGTPAGQLNGQQNPNGQSNPFGQSQSGFGQQSNGFGQQQATPPQSSQPFGQTQQQ